MMRHVERQIDLGVGPSNCLRQPVRSRVGPDDAERRGHLRSSAGPVRASARRSGSCGIDLRPDCPASRPCLCRPVRRWAAQNCVDQRTNTVAGAAIGGILGAVADRASPETAPMPQVLWLVAL